jgi:NTP pyrophosphatase (non-canonical NTP hydrolase)
MTKVKDITDYAKWVDKMWVSFDTEKRSDDRSLAIASLGLAGETGESLEHIKKYFRDGVFDETAFKKEMGDGIYYWIKILNHFNIDPMEVLQMNVQKIEDRRARNVQHGSGDNR